MKQFVKILKVELLKIFLSKAWWIILGLVIFLQPLIAIISVQLGLEATPQTHPDLVQALPPVEYSGFYDIVPFGIFPMIVLGGILGGSEFRNHCLRSAFLGCSNRNIVFAAKIVSILISSLLLSVAAIWLTIAATHSSLGELGLNPLRLSFITWQFIFYASVEWVLLTLLAFAIGLICRNLIVPLLFLLPQVYGLAAYFSAKTSWGEYLPVAAGKLLTATPTDSWVHSPCRGGIILGLWGVVFLIGAGYSFIHQDVGGVY